MPNQTGERPHNDIRDWLGYKNLTLIDWLKMSFSVMIPVMIGVFTCMLMKNDTELNKKNRENDIQLALILGNETIFNDYIKNMADVILTTTTASSRQYAVTRALTLTTLRQLDFDKKRRVLQFLYETNIIKRWQHPFGQKVPTVKMDLNGAVLDSVDLSNYQFPYILLMKISFVNAKFIGTNLRSADFSGSTLTDARFSNSDLNGAKFRNVQAQRADFTDAQTNEIDFINANLTQAIISDEQISRASLIYNLILPNGTFSRNKTFLFNGDGKQLTRGWKIISGAIDVQCKDGRCYFVGKQKSTMFQQANVTEYTKRYYLSDIKLKLYETFQYCLSLSYYGHIVVNITYLSADQWTVIEKFSKVLSPRINYEQPLPTESSLLFSYWSYCHEPKNVTYFIGLEIKFDGDNATKNLTAVEDIQFTIYRE